MAKNGPSLNPPLSLAEATKIVSAHLWKAVENEPEEVKIKSIEAIGTILGMAKIGEYMQLQLKSINEKN